MKNGHPAVVVAVAVVTVAGREAREAMIMVTMRFLFYSTLVILYHSSLSIVVGVLFVCLLLFIHLLLTRLGPGFFRRQWCSKGSPCCSKRSPCGSANRTNAKTSYLLVVVVVISLSTTGILSCSTTGILVTVITAIVVVVVVVCFIVVG
jgi:hypothetical protein